MSELVSICEQISNVYFLSYDSFRFLLHVWFTLQYFLSCMLVATTVQTLRTYLLRLAKKRTIVW